MLDRLQVLIADSAINAAFSKIDIPATLRDVSNAAPAQARIPTAKARNLTKRYCAVAKAINPKNVEHRKKKVKSLASMESSSGVARKQRTAKIRATMEAELSHFCYSVRGSALSNFSISIIVTALMRHLRLPVPETYD